jgi:hypothetical protein
MITKEKALEIAKRFIEAEEMSFDDKYLIVEQSTIEYNFGWLFFYESEKFITTGKISYALAGNGPLFVDKNGKITELDSSKTVEEHEKKLKLVFDV